MKVSLKNTFDLPSRGCAELARFTRKHHLPRLFVSAVDHALAEHLQNLVRHSGANSISLSFRIEGRTLVVVARDNGLPFDPTTVPEPDVERMVEQGRKGGIGIHLMRRLVDQLAYERRGRWNIITILKGIP